ncbi:hypothetical protein PsorP6_003152 [Peronosclerospora sorghi]|uniref:Uncharacterized protein n=1 Tax=Peronosclerospora sorghi TaxID=230839 RepID=A0ACC0VQ43_9STRA|nr:hypothetical protein PsorP6_003152 [Peronosclerospora sorghi]
MVVELRDFPGNVTTVGKEKKEESNDTFTDVSNDGRSKRALEAPTAFHDYTHTHSLALSRFWPEPLQTNTPSDSGVSVKWTTSVEKRRQFTWVQQKGRAGWRDHDSMDDTLFFFCSMDLLALADQDTLASPTWSKLSDHLVCKMSAQDYFQQKCFQSLDQ